MGLRIEFDHEGRTYAIDSQIIRWNIHAVGLLVDKMSLVTDVNTGTKLFVNWDKVPVIRLVSDVDDDGSPR